MQLSTKGRYAIMAMYRLYTQLKVQPVVPLSLVAEMDGISLVYLEQLFTKLRKAGLVNSVRGQAGGYTLRDNPGAITLAEIVTAADENIEFTRCGNTGEKHCGAAGGQCKTHALWEQMSHHMLGFLTTITLEHIDAGDYQVITPLDKPAIEFSTACYMDYNATTPLAPQVRQVMMQAMDWIGNPSSTHEWGRAVKHHIQKARKRIAAAVDADPSGVVFTSGGTESNHLALSFLGFPKASIYASATEHASIHGNILPQNLVPVDQHGLVRMDALEDILKASDAPKLLSIAMANSETGVVQHHLREIVTLCKTYGWFLHTDAVQAFGKIPVSFKDLGVDFMSVSAHKLMGPKGVGALIYNPQLVVKPLLLGGGQEFGLRSGTENIPAILGFAEAADHIDLNAWQSVRSVIDYLMQRCKDINPNVHINSSSDGLPNTLNISTPGLNKDIQVAMFDKAQVYVSAGSACSSGVVKKSHVLKSMGLPDHVIESAIRISLGPKATIADADRLIAAWAQMLPGQAVAMNNN